MTIRISREDYDRLDAHWRRARPNEEGGFAIVGLVKAPDGPILTVRELLLPSPGDWEDQGRHWLTPTTSYINRAVMRADHLQAGILFFHSHPDARHPAELSDVDERSTDALFANLASIIPGAPLASIVFTEETVAGVLEVDGERHEVSRVVVLGPRVATVLRKRPPRARSAEEWDRQVRAIGLDAQARLRSARVAVIGAGGTGSAVLEQLARLGVLNVTILDDDKLELSNVSRVYGSTAKDVGQSKARVAARHYEAILPEANVTAIENSVLDPATWPRLAGMDLVFGCTDTDSSRAVLNDLAYQAFVPVIDTGCKVDVGPHGLRSILGRVRYLRPGAPCLWCTETIDGRRVLQESLSHEERESLKRSGYGGDTTPQPMVVHLTTATAALAVAELLKLVGEIGPEHSGDTTMIDLLGPTVHQISGTIQPTCRCQTTYGRGLSTRG